MSSSDSFFNTPKSAVVFTDQQECIDTTISNSKKYKSRRAFEIIETTKQLEQLLYPRVKDFCKRKSSKQVSNRENMFSDHEVLFSNQRLPLYSDSVSAAENTIKYVFDQFYRTIFVQILDNKIHTFIILCNKNKTLSPELLKHLKLNPDKYNSKYDLLRDARGKGANLSEIEIRKDSSVYFTDCIVNLWDRPVHNIMYEDWQVFMVQYHILSETLKHRKIKDTQFILNDKDQHILMSDGVSSPHFHILSKYNSKLKGYGKTFIPILNHCSHKRFADIPIPTNDDWEILTNQYYLGSCRSNYINIRDHINTNFDKKIPTAIFRGSSTGCGTIIKNNARLKVAYLSKKYFHHPVYGSKANGGVPFLDARITSFTKSVKKHYSSNYIERIDPDNLQLRVGSKLPIGQISNHKYVINIEGNIAAFRLTLELSYGSVILFVQNDFSLWYQKLLKPWVHYVPVKPDLSDLMEQISWCRSHDDECRVIASNALKFYHKYITIDSVYDYMQMALSQ